MIFKLQQVQLYYAGLSRYIGLFDTREEAAVAYEMARDCCDSFTEENPTKDQVKRNLALMRKAAFAGGWYKKNLKQSEEQDEMAEDPEEVKPATSRKRDRSVGRYAAESNSDADAGRTLSGLRSALVATKPVCAWLAVEPKRVSKRTKVAEKKKQPTKKIVQPPQRVAEQKQVMVNVEEEDRKRRIRSDIYQRADRLAKELPRGITVRPSGKWVRPVLQLLLVSFVIVSLLMLLLVCGIFSKSSFTTPESLATWVSLNRK